MFFSGSLGPRACQAAGPQPGDLELSWDPWPDWSCFSFQRKLYVNSQWEVSQVPLDLCEVYTGGCHGCLMARDPYCGWYQDRCVSIYSSQEYVGRAPAPRRTWTQQWCLVGSVPSGQPPSGGHRCCWPAVRTGKGPGLWPPVFSASLFLPAPGPCCSPSVRSSRTRAAPARSQVPIRPAQRLQSSAGGTFVP